MPVFAVTTAKGVNWDHACGMRQQRFWDEHAAFADRLVGQGVVIIGGPIDSAPGVPHQGHAPLDLVAR